MNTSANKQHELGRHLATYYQINRGGIKVATFQSSTDAIIYADEQSYEQGIEYEVHTVNVYENGTEATLYMVSKPMNKA